MMRAVLALLAMSAASSAQAQAWRPGFAPGFRPGFQFLGDFPTPGTVADYDFRRDRYSGPPLTVSRVSPAYIDDSAGNWTLVPANTLRRSDKGVLIEGAQTNLALHSGDLSNAVWAKAGATATATQAGIEGAPNAASLLTATAANGQATQAITSASSLRTTSVFLRRISGTGGVQITQDNTNWTSCPISSAWSRCQISATLANPVVGVRLATAGDAVAVDIVQNETWASGITTVGGASSPIRTTGAAATRAADVVSAVLGTGVTDMTMALVGRTAGMPVAAAAMGEISDGSASNALTLRYNSGASAVLGVSTRGGVQATNIPSPGAPPASNTRFAVSFGQATNGDAATSLNGAATGVATSNQPANPPLNTIRIGSAFNVPAYWFGYIERLAIWPTRLTNGQLQQYSTLATWGG